METINITFLVLCVVSARAATNIDPRIIGGKDAVAGQFPYQVSLRQKFMNHHYCGGSIISDRLILTAAHCATGDAGDPSKVYAMVGAIFLSRGGTRIDLEKIIRHEEYIENPIEHDIALIRTTTMIVFSSYVSPIELATLEIGEELVVSGWGYTEYDQKKDTGQTKDIMQYVEQTSFSWSKCREFYDKQDAVKPGNLCTMNKVGAGNCKGDSGGPLVDPVRGQLVGIVSFGIPCALGFPDVYTDVRKYRAWIQQHSTSAANLSSPLQITIIIFSICSLVLNKIC